MNSVEQIIEDKELGILRIRTLQRARRLTFRTKSDAIYVSVPPSATRAEIMQAIRQLRPQLLLAKRKLQKPVIDLNYRIQADCFKLSLVQGILPHFWCNPMQAVLRLSVLLKLILGMHICRNGCGK